MRLEGRFSRCSSLLYVNKGKSIENIKAIVTFTLEAFANFWKLYYANKKRNLGDRWDREQSGQFTSFSFLFPSCFFRVHLLNNVHDYNGFFRFSCLLVNVLVIL